MEYTQQQYTVNDLQIMNTEQANLAPPTTKSKSPKVDNILNLFPSSFRTSGNIPRKFSHRMISGDFSIRPEDRLEIKAFVHARAYAIAPTPSVLRPQVGTPSPETLARLRQAPRVMLEFVELPEEEVEVKEQGSLQEAGDVQDD
ncbi:hypothetical protein EV363DRAFT_1297411 [Boletus edulis]|nr:hypothetical protein EV363DRAFT_1297411 [Boletus edulis]